MNLTNQNFSTGEIISNCAQSCPLLNLQPFPFVVFEQNGTIQYLNDQFSSLVGYQKEELVGKKTRVLTTDETSFSLFSSLQEIPEIAKTRWQGNVRIKSKEKGTVPCRCTVSAVTDQNNTPTHFLSVNEQIHDFGKKRYVSEKSIPPQTEPQQYDVLTGLPNRWIFQKHIQKRTQILMERKSTNECSLVYVRLRDLQSINSDFGDSIGDMAIQHVGHVLLDFLPKNALLSRFSGDQFMIFLEETKASEVKEFVDEIFETLDTMQLPILSPAHSSKKMTSHYESIKIGVHIGILNFSPYDEDTDSVTQYAEDASRINKDYGDSCIYTWQATDKRILEKKSIRKAKQKIRRALVGDRYDFILHAQPIRRPCDTGKKTSHFEVLVRMYDRQERCMIPPNDFIPAAESEPSLMNELDRLVIRKAVESCKTILAVTDTEIETCSINVSITTLCSEGFITFLEDVFLSTGVSPKKICFEITERAAVTSPEQAIDIIKHIKNTLGCRFSLDDFGTGHSQMILLKKLPIDYLKIDGIFIKNMDDFDEMLIKKLKDLCDLKGIKIIAEYVENEMILQKVGLLNIDFAQGYVFGRPQPILEQMAA